MTTATPRKIALEAAQILLDSKAALINVREPFVYTSGRKGPAYVDVRRIISFPKERGRLMDMGAELVRDVIGEKNVDYVAGGETAGIPYAAFLSERLKKPMLYIRKKPKGFGRMAQIEGHMEEAGKKVLIVEDVQNFGSSIKIFIDALKAAGAVADHVFVVFQHGHAGSKKAVAELGINVHALCTWWDILEVARAKKYFDEATLASVEEFLNDPEGWSDKHSGTKAAL